MAADEARQLLYEEVRALREQCALLWECLKNKNVQDMVAYVRSSSTQFLLLKGKDVLAKPSSSNNIYEYNYVYSVDRADLVKLDEFLAKGCGFGIVTEKCCPFLAFDILTNLHKEKFSLEALKTVEFIQAIPGAGKSYTMIQEHDPRRSLLVTQTKSGRDDLRVRVRRRFGDIDVRHCVTTASILVNGSKPYAEVYFDEAAQQHAGFAAYVASLTGCKKMVCIGDRRQIPFIVRVDSFICRYQNLWEIIPTVRNLIKTYRIPSKQLRLVEPFYRDVVNEPISSARDTDVVINVFPYSDELLNQAVFYRKYAPGTCSYVLLTFTQGEKADVLAKIGVSKNDEIRIEGFKGVYTRCCVKE